MATTLGIAPSRSVRRFFVVIGPPPVRGLVCQAAVGQPRSLVELKLGGRLKRDFGGGAKPPDGGIAQRLHTHAPDQRVILCKRQQAGDVAAVAAGVLGNLPSRRIAERSEAVATDIRFISAPTPTGSP
jgi:hypothetical protein